MCTGRAPPSYVSEQQWEWKPRTHGSRSFIIQFQSLPPTGTWEEKSRWDRWTLSHHKEPPLECLDSQSWRAPPRYSLSGMLLKNCVLFGFTLSYSSFNRVHVETSYCCCCCCFFLSAWNSLFRKWPCSLFPILIMVVKIYWSFSHFFYMSDSEYTKIFPLNLEKQSDVVCWSKVKCVCVFVRDFSHIFIHLSFWVCHKFIRLIFFFCFTEMYILMSICLCVNHRMNLWISSFSFPCLVFSVFIFRLHVIFLLVYFLFYFEGSFSCSLGFHYAHLPLSSGLYLII